MKQKLTIEDIKTRIESAVYVMRLLPNVRVQGYRAAVLDVIYTPQEKMLMDKKPIRIYPTGEQITQMDEVLTWLEVLEPWERKLVWKRGARIPWKFLCREFGFHRSKLTEKYNVSLAKLVVWSNKNV